MAEDAVENSGGNSYHVQPQEWETRDDKQSWWWWWWCSTAYVFCFVEHKLTRSLSPA